MKIIYQSANYKPENVTGFYVRYQGKKNGFRIYETSTLSKGLFAGKPGMGPTLREYDTDGKELPQDLRDKCMTSYHTEFWKLA